MTAKLFLARWEQLVAFSVERCGIETRDVLRPAHQSNLQRCMVRAAMNVICMSVCTARYDPQNSGTIDERAFTEVVTERILLRNPVEEVVKVFCGSTAVSCALSPAAVTLGLVLACLG